MADTPGPRVVITQVYGGGGNSGATFQNDFVELFNAGGAAQDLSSWSIQYASATGTGQLGVTNQIAPLTGSIAPGQYYLVKLRSTAAVGALLPTADVTYLNVDMAAGSGKVALVNQATSLGCNGGSTPCSDEQKSHIIDLVGYGTANYFETAPTPTLSSSKSARRVDRCVDTQNNAADFTTDPSPPLAPRNSSSPIAPCVVVVGPLANVEVAGGTVSSDQTITLTAILKDANGVTINDPAATFAWTSTDDEIAEIVSTNGNQATIEGGNPGTATINVTATSNGVTKPAATGAAITVVGPLHRVTVTGETSVAAGSTITLTATLKDAVDQTIVDPAATYVWTSADPATAQVLSTSGNAATIKGLIPGGPITISLTATSNSIAKSPAPQHTVTVTGAPVIVPSSTVVSEVHYDNNGTDKGEAFEIQGDAGATLEGWSLVLYNGSNGQAYHTTALSGSIPATCGATGVVVINFPDTELGTIQNGPDAWALVNASGQVTEFISYEGAFAATNGPANGLTSTQLPVSETNATGTSRSIQRALNSVWYGPRTSTFGACNSPEPLGAQGSIILTQGKSELSLGMQTQFFYSGTDASGQPVTSVVYSTSDATVITVDPKGIVTAKKLGSAQLIATAPDGATGTVDMTVYLAPGSTGIRLGHNEEFGQPVDANPSDDFIIRRAQYTVSYNPNRGGANWVSWNLSASHIGSSGRCPGTCYSADTALTNAGLTAYTTADWVSGGQWDRGHMAPSADWTASEADNNTTFFLTNFLPQRADLNQGPWEDLESALRDSIAAGREAYIIAGGIFTNGTGLGSIQGLGKIWIPDSTYKIAIIMPAGAGIGPGGTLPANTTVMAVNMPNVTGIRFNDWRMYLTSIAKIERSTGYNFLDLLSEPTECLAEGRNCAPTARITSTSGFTIIQGESILFSAATSSDPNEGDMLTKAWLVNGVPAGSGETLNYTFENDGTYQVKLVVTDNDGFNSTAVATVLVKSTAQGIADLQAILPTLGSNHGQIVSLGNKLENAAADVGSGQVANAKHKLEQFIAELEKLVGQGRANATVANQMIAYARRVVASL